jgi:hypothetical protein
MNGSDAAIYWSSLSWGAVLLNIMPFAGLLALIAILPLVESTAQWWDSLRNKALVAAVCAVSGVALYVLPTGDGGRVLETALDYGAFLALLTSLFVISGGIHVSGSFAGFPRTNTALLALGAILANLLGTTGASMLLIRPLLHANRKRSHKVAYRGVLHFHRLELWGTAHAARRPSPVSWVSAGGAVRLDAEVGEGMGVHQRDSSGSVQFSGRMVFRERGTLHQGFLGGGRGHLAEIAPPAGKAQPGSARGRDGDAYFCPDTW